MLFNPYILDLESVYDEPSVVKPAVQVIGF